MVAPLEVHAAPRNTNDPTAFIKNWTAAGAAFDGNRGLIRFYSVFVVLGWVLDTNELSFKTVGVDFHWFALVGEVQKLVSRVRESYEPRPFLRDFQRHFGTGVRERVVWKFCQEIVGLDQRNVRLIGD